MFHRFVMAAPCLTVLALATPAAAASKPAAYRIAATEVVIGDRIEEAAWLKDHLASASTQEARYYDPALAPATLRITVEKVKTKSAGKAIASSLPLVGLFAGSNENKLAGRIEIVKPASGKVLARHKIISDDGTEFSAADGMLTVAQIGASFLPFGGLLSAAAEAGRSGAKRSEAQEKLVNGFVMLSYKKLYGNDLYKSFAARRKADLTPPAAAPTAPPVAAPATVAAAVAPARTAPPALR